MVRGTVDGSVTIFRQACATILRAGCYAVIVLSAISLSTGRSPAGEGPQLPKSLDPLLRDYPAQTTIALKSLGRGLEQYQAGQYTAALEELKTSVPAGSTALDDFSLLYTAKAYLMLDKAADALPLFRLVQSRFPNSSQLSEARLGECDASLKEGLVEAALNCLQDSGIELGSEVRFRQAHAYEEAGNREKAIGLYLRIYADFVNSKNSASAEQRLLALSPGFQTRTANYQALLRRSQNLLRAGRNRDAQSLLLKLAKVRPPDSAGAERRNLLLAETLLNLGKTSAALLQLQKISKADPSLHAQSLYLRAACYRKLQMEDAFLGTRDTAVRLYTNSPATEKILYSAATHFDVANDIKRAQEAYRAICSMFPRGEFAERASWKVALYNYFLKQYEESLKGFRDYLYSYPTTSSGAASAYWLGRCYAALRDYHHASRLFMHVRRLSNHGYYGQRALAADEAIKRPAESPESVYSGIDFDQLNQLLHSIQVPQVVISEPQAPVALLIERARQLLVAGLPDLAIAELRWGAARHPKDAALSYVLSRIYEKRYDYFGVIATLRRAFPDYDARPLDAMPNQIWELLFPIQHWEIISSNAARNHLDPNLILGLIRQESAFDESARSRANARGLMQVLPSTGRKLAPRSGVYRYGSNKLYTANTNIVLGTRYLAQLMERYGDKEELVLAAYNAGDSRVETWLSEFGNLDMAEFVERVPFSETRAYIKQVLTNRAYYRLLTPALIGSRD